jgi:hypothetical protein
MQKWNVVEEHKGYKRRKRAYKEQGVIQAPNILGDEVSVAFVGNCLVGGPKVCSRVGLGLLRFPACNCILEPNAKKS